MVLGVCHFDLCTSKMKWISEFSIQTEQSGPAVFSRLAITQVETGASQYQTLSTLIWYIFAIFANIFYTIVDLGQLTHFRNINAAMHVIILDEYFHVHKCSYKTQCWVQCILQIYKQNLLVNFCVCWMCKFKLCGRRAPCTRVTTPAPYLTTSTLQWGFTSLKVNWQTLK